VKHGIQNSRIETHLGVIRNLLDDIANLIEAFQSFRFSSSYVTAQIERDYRYIERRVRNEGLSFLTVVLPSLGKWYDSILAGNMGPIPVGLTPHVIIDLDDREIVCPRFAHIYMRILHSDTGSHREKGTLIRAFRSLFFLFYKLEVPFTPVQLETALEQWKQNEQELFEHNFPDYFDSDTILARDIISSLFSHDLDEFKTFTPAHGPGAVAGGEDNEEKWATAHYIPSLHSVYAWYDLYFPYRSGGRISPHMFAEYTKFWKKSKRIEATSRLLFVPKDSRGPRTISCEPKELMFVQQGVSRNLMRGFSNRTHGRIMFIDQTQNGKLALESSSSQAYATVDLKDASDRVTTKLVDLLFPEGSLRYLHALRSTSTILPDGSLYKDHLKYAPMGSALCFPIESAIFWALAVVAAINAGASVPVARANTYVYGDDIIIRPEYFDEFIKVFTKFALKVNIGKSYVSGPFRESCGVDAWEGIDVTPFKIKKDISRRSLDGPLALACCKYASTCFSYDFRKTGEYLHRLVSASYPGIPVHDRPLGCLSIVDELRPLNVTSMEHGYSTEACRVWIKGWVLSSALKPCDLDGLSRFLRASYGSWEVYDPSMVALRNRAKIRKRKVFVG
jgi:hypothetical protein